MWNIGRQNTGYKKLTIFNKKINLFNFYGFDTYIIKYIDGNYIPKHIDEVKFGKHYRINIILKKCEGGEFICKNYKSYLNGRIIFFRPDLEEHEVTVCKGTRLILSIGWLIL